MTLCDTQLPQRIRLFIVIQSSSDKPPKVSILSPPPMSEVITSFVLFLPINFQVTGRRTKEARGRVERAGSTGRVIKQRYAFCCCTIKHTNVLSIKHGVSSTYSTQHSIQHKYQSFCFLLLRNWRCGAFTTCCLSSTVSYTFWFWVNRTCLWQFALVLCCEYFE